MELLSPSLGLIFRTCILIIFFGFWVFALVDISRSDFKGRNEKMLWGLVILFIPFLGSVPYFAIGRKSKVKLNQY